MQVLANFSPMMCEQALGLIHLELDGEIDAHEQILLRHHVQGCVSCRGAQGLYARVKEGMVACHDVEAPVGLSARIRRQRRDSRLKRGSIWAGVALSCLLVGALTWPLNAPAVPMAEGLLEEAKEIHALNLPVDVASKSRARLVEMLRGVGPVQVPMIEGFDVSGARVLAAGKKAQLVYRDPLGNRLSIVVSRGVTPRAQSVVSDGLRYIKVGPLDDKRFVALFKR